MRAELVRDHFGIPAERLTFARANVNELEPDRVGTFDVVLMLGLVYHLENPIGALRTMRRLTGRLCVVEAQLTEQRAPIRHGWGVTDEFEAEPASWAARLEPGQETHPIASHGGVISLIPNRAALLQVLEAAGFRRVEPLPVPAGLNRQYVGGHRLVVAAWP